MATKEPKKEWTLEEELKTNEQLRKEDVVALREFCTDLPDVDVSKVTDNVLVAIIHSSEYDMEKARQTASAHFGIRFSLPEIFSDFDFDSEAIQQALEVGCYCPLPKRTPEGYQIIFQSLRNRDPSVYDHAALTKVQILTMDSCIHENPTCPGYVLIGDMEGLTMTHIWRANFNITKKLMKFSQEGSALKIQSMHMLNSSSFTYYVMKMLKPFLSKHIYDMFQFYTADQLDEFLKVVPKECLPEDYGGDLAKLNVLCDEQKKWLRTMHAKLELAPKKY